MTIRLLDAAIVLVAASLLVILAFGGFDAAAGPLTVRLHNWTRPSMLLAIACAVRLWRGATLRDASRLGLLALLLGTSIAYVQHHVRVAGGLDSQGYVSAARLVASGRLVQPEPFAHLLPLDRAEQTAVSTPLGYVPHRTEYASVPRFPLGLPFVMAVFTVFGPAGPFFVPLVAAFVALGIVFLMVRRIDGEVAALFAAVLVAADPLMFHYAVQPMSDVPALCWLLVALWLRLDRPDAAFAAGLCAGMAVLTRPVLFPAVLVLGAVTAEKGSGAFFGGPLCEKGTRPLFVFASAVMAFLGIQMVLNHMLYGSAAMSGYGTASHMFELSVRRMWANVANYGKWLTYSHGVIFWLLWPASLVVLRRERRAWQLSAVAVAAALPYLFYLVFDDWESSRFLLPTIVLVFVLFAHALARMLHPSHLAHLVFPVLALLFCLSSHRFLAAEGVYQFGSVESKYALVGEWFKSHTSARAVVVSGLHSGSIRMYGNRVTLRWDEIPPSKLQALVATLQRDGYELFMALDNPSEPPAFERRFGRNAAAFAEPIARVRVVDIYRFLSAH